MSDAGDGVLRMKRRRRITRSANEKLLLAGTMALRPTEYLGLMRKAYACIILRIYL